MFKRIALFLVLNFLGLAIGGSFTGEGVPSDWYQNLNQAPWTPPGWVFGAAWSIIMITFAVYMAYLLEDHIDRSKVIMLFAVQWVLNVIWNPIFFYYHGVMPGLVVISLLALLISYFLFYFWNDLKLKSLLILPYFFWIIIATSLNAYILIMN